jgi:hypothetical protein
MMGKMGTAIRLIQDNPERGKHDPDAGNEMGKQRQTGDHLMREPLMAWFSPMIVERCTPPQG